MLEFYLGAGDVWTFAVDSRNQSMNDCVSERIMKEEIRFQYGSYCQLLRLRGTILGSCCIGTFLVIIS
jgi:hypothetical protein